MRPERDLRYCWTESDGHLKVLIPSPVIYVESISHEADQ